MKILDKYIAKQLLLYIFTVLSFLVIVVTLLDFIDEIKKIGYGYSILLAFLHVLLNTPQNIYEVLPIATLMGSLIGLSKLSSTNELNAAKSSGVSFSQIIIITIKTGMFIVILTFLIGEFLAPKGQQLANEIKNLSQSTRLSMKNTDGIWIKSHDSFIHIAKVYPDKIVQEISLYRFNEKQQLMESLYAEEGIYKDGKWIIKNITSTSFKNEIIEISNEESAIFDEFIDLDLFDIMVVKPEQMTIMQLKKYTQYLNDNSMESKNYELAYWSKFTIPLSCLIMFLLTTPFVHSNIRSASFGQRIFIGMLVGITLFLFNQTISKLSIILDIPPVVGSFLPIFILLGLSFYIIYRFYGLNTLLKLFSK
ncbi:MAG: LPS export ABC transporter permease LptG [Gammaproteobacteria bacterium]|jgi:lipopolysaccharide export system permease protein|nr:LPS export ABC transporter permease LptG [Gammaproteobacteria bacterium]MBT7603202.1 LPS export ABC transporter permease LptG [Gammaproteobacteria bacterium]